MDPTKLFMRLSTCGMCPRRSLSKKMEASFCSLAPVEDAVRGLVNGIESVEFMIIPGWKVKTTYWMHRGRTCREVSGSSGREASGTVANGSAGVHVRRAARKGDVLVQIDKPRSMVPPIFFSAALAGCRVLRCCAKPGVWSPLRRDKQQATLMPRGFSSQRRHRASPRDPGSRRCHKSKDTKWGHLVRAACSKAFGCGPLARCVRFTSQLSIGIG